MRKRPTVPTCQHNRLTPCGKPAWGQFRLADPAHPYGRLLVWEWLCRKHMDEAQQKYRNWDWKLKSYTFVPNLSAERRVCAATMQLKDDRDYYLAWTTQLVSEWQKAHARINELEAELAGKEGQ